MVSIDIIKNKIKKIVRDAGIGLKKEEHICYKPGWR